MGLGWATFQPAQAPNQDDCLKRVYDSTAQECERAETALFIGKAG